VSAGRPARIESLLREALQPAEVAVDDDSAAHAGHAGARGGGGHYVVRIVSPRFAGLAMLERHRLVYAALGGMIPAEIHALTIQALTPEQASASPS
jgi:BolA protein